MRVLVVRPQAAAERTAARLSALGHEALVAPVVQIKPTGEPAPEEPFDALALTSANALPALAAIRHRLEGRPVFAVGRRTAEAIAATGVSPVHEAAGEAVLLAQLIGARLPPGGRVLHIAGQERKSEPETALRAAGFRVQVWEAYGAVPVARLPDRARRALEGGSIEAVLHYSRCSAAILVTLADEAGCLPALGVLTHACLSPDTAAPLRALGAGRLIVAPRPDEDSLLLALAGKGDSPASRPLVPKG